MTRKQAISKAIEILSQDTGNEETVKKLTELLEEMPIYQWTQKSIIDSIEEYVLRNGNLPPSTQLVNENDLPSKAVIENRFNMTSIIDFYEEYFPNYPMQSSSPYKNKGDDYYLNVFKENYERIKKERNLKHVTIREYDKYREKGTPVQTIICRQCRCATYRELLKKCGYLNPRLPMSSKLNISYSKNGDELNKELKSMVEEIRNPKS